MNTNYCQVIDDNLNKCPKCGTVSYYEQITKNIKPDKSETYKRCMACGNETLLSINTWSAENPQETFVYEKIN